MITLVRRWLLTAAPLMLGISMLTFVLASLVPGDAARSIAGANATPEEYQAIRDELGLDQPLPVRYWDWLTSALQGDLGSSMASGDTVWHQIQVRLGVTLVLVVGSLLVAAVVGVGLGLLSALRGGISGRIVDVVSLLGLAIPPYWLGLVLAAVFAVTWQVFPATGYIPFSDSPAEWFDSLVLPIVTLGLTSSAQLAKQTRDGVRTELNKDYVRVLRARGIPERSVIGKHVLRNAAPAIVTVLGLVMVGLLSGTILVETVFVMPGLGGLSVTSTQAHDVPVIQGIAVFFTGIVVLVNLLVEIAYAALNPKVRTS